MNSIISFQLMIFEIGWINSFLSYAFNQPEISQILIDHGAEVDIAETYVRIYYLFLIDDWMGLDE